MCAFYLGWACLPSSRQVPRRRSGTSGPLPRRSLIWPKSGHPSPNRFRASPRLSQRNRLDGRAHAGPRPDPRTRPPFAIGRHCCQCNVAGASIDILYWLSVEVGRFGSSRSALDALQTHGQHSCRQGGCTGRRVHGWRPHLLMGSGVICCSPCGALKKVGE